MLLRFSYATFVALGSVAGTDAFLSSPVRPAGSVVLQVSGMDSNEGFLDALSGQGSNISDEGNEDSEVSEGGSSRFKAMMAAAKSQQGAAEERPVAIENPFINPSTPTQPSDLESLSVEDQARMFREMMQQQQQQSAPPPQYSAPPPQRTAKTDRAGRPVGRNRDADQIANSADLYFAQLKRDSTVRTLARIREEDDIANDVMGDAGIQELDNLLQKNPYLTGQREKEMALIETVPEEVIAPYFKTEEEDEEKLSSSGISYKEKLKQMRAKRTGGDATVTPEPQTVPDSQPITQQPMAQSTAAVESVQPTPVVEPAQPVEVVTTQPTTEATPASPSNPEDTRQKIRTLMGLLLKHRGGPGFGSGRLKGPEIDRFENLLQEITPILREEALNSAPQDVPMMTVPVTPAPQVGQEMSTQPSSLEIPSATSSSIEGPADMVQVESAVACIEGALTMYKNSPPGLKESVLVTLRAALMSAASTCNDVLGNDDNVNPSAYQAAGEVDSAIACVEGAITMYKNSPPSLKDPVLATLRAALMSAVNTCNTVIANNEVASAAAFQVLNENQPTAQLAEPVAPAATKNPEPIEPTQQIQAQTLGNDENSKILEKIYNNVKMAAGDGSLGLKSDLSSEEAAELADQLQEMRGILMEELNSGIPDEGAPASKPKEVAKAASASGSSVSNYKQMLAKARAEKAAPAL